MDTTRAIATLLRYADRHNAPAGFVAMLWRLRAEPQHVQLARLEQLCSAMYADHQAAVARGQ